MFDKKGVLKDFTKFTGKHLCQSLSVLQPAKILENLFCRAPRGDCYEILID